MAKRRTEGVATMPTEAGDPPANGAAVAIAPEAEKRLPLKKIGPISTGKGENITVTVWDNQHERDGETFTVYNVVLQASYYDAQAGDWKTAKSLRGSQIPVAIYALQRAFDVIMNDRDPANPCPF